MYERFTDRARKVMQLANQEAQRFNHEYIGTEHVLLGLVKIGSGVASTALANLGATIAGVRLQVEKMIGSGPDMVTMGKLPQTPRAKRAMQTAIDRASELGHSYVGTEHILMGLVADGESPACHSLMNLGITPAQVLFEVKRLMGEPRPIVINNPATGPNITITAGDSKVVQLGIGLGNSGGICASEYIPLSPLDAASQKARELHAAFAQFKAKLEEARKEGIECRFHRSYLGMSKPEEAWVLAAGNGANIDLSVHIGLNP